MIIELLVQQHTLILFFVLERKTYELRKDSFLFTDCFFSFFKGLDILLSLSLLINQQVVHNASILNAVGVTGLQLYNFGRTVTIPFWSENWRPTSFYDKIKINIQCGMHTLCLLGHSQQSSTLFFEVINTSYRCIDVVVILSRHQSKRALN
jgi:hypothetical protein